MPNNPINKVVYGGRTLIDLSSDTITAADLTRGKTAHDKSGNAIVGTNDGGGGGGATPYTLSVSLDDCTATGALEYNKQMTSGTYTAAKAAYDSGARVDLALSGGVTVPGTYFTNGSEPLTVQGQVFHWLQFAYITYDGSNYVGAFLSATLSSSDVFTVSVANISGTIVLAIEDATPVSETEFMYTLSIGGFGLSEKMLNSSIYPRLTLTMGGSPACDCFIKTSGHDSDLDMDYIEGEMLLPNYPAQGMYVLFDVKAFQDDTVHLYITDILSVNH